MQMKTIRDKKAAEIQAQKRTRHALPESLKEDENRLVRRSPSMSQCHLDKCCLSYLPPTRCSNCRPYQPWPVVLLHHIGQ